MSEKIIGDIYTGDSFISMELIFNSPKPENIENVRINNVVMYCNKNHNNTFKKILSLKYDNYSNSKATNIKYGDRGEIIVHHTLINIVDEWNNIFEIKPVNKNEYIFYSMILSLCCRNSFGVYKEYECCFKFRILNSKIYNEYDCNYDIEIYENVMWAENVKINNA